MQTLNLTCRAQDFDLTHDQMELVRSDTPPKFKSPFYMLAYQALDLPALRKRTENHFQTSFSHDQTAALQLIASQALAIDHNLTEWFKSLPPSYSYISVPSTSFTYAAWPGVVHIYHNRISTFTINLYRVFRIFTLGVAIRCLARLYHLKRTKRYRRLHWQTLFTVRKLVNEICATVPYSLGKTLQSTTQPPGSYKSSAGIGLSGWYLLRSLYIAQLVDCILEEQRTWIKGHVHLIMRMFYLDIPERKMKIASIVGEWSIEHLEEDHDYEDVKKEWSPPFGGPEVFYDP